MSDSADKWYLSGPLGIDTPDPPQQLSITDGIGFANHNAKDKKLYSPSDGVLEWMTHDWAAQHGFAVSHQGEQRVFLNTNGDSYLKGGRLGIGTNEPKNPLHVSGALGIRQNSLYLSGAAGGSSVSYNAHRNETNNAWVFPDPNRTAVTLEIDDAVEGKARFDIWTTTKANKTGFVHRLRVDGESGNVGIGTTTPHSPLEVMQTVNDLSTGLQFSGQHTPGLTAGGVINSYDANGTYVRPLTLQSNGGDVGIGETNPKAKLHVNGDTLINGNLHWTKNPDSGDGYVCLGNLQLCWGTISFPMNDSNYEYQQEITFSKPFSPTPVITASLNDPGYGSDAMDTVVGVLNKQADKFTVVVKRLHIATYYLHAGPIEVSWIAVGKR